MPGIPVTGTPRDLKNARRRRGPLARSRATGSVAVTVPMGKASVSNNQSLQRQPDLLRPLDSEVPRDVSWNRRPVAPAPAPGTTYPATAEAVGAARGQVAGIALEAGASEPALADVKLAVGEALSNAVFHAYAASGVRGETFTVSTAADGPLFSVWVTDAGEGGTPEVPSSGLGLGLQLMAKLCQRLEIGVLADGRSQVELRFDLGAAAGDPASSARSPAIVSPAPPALDLPAETQPQMRQNCARCGLAIRPRFAWLTVDYCPRCLARDRVAIGLRDPDCSPGDRGCDDAHRLGARDRSIDGG